MAQPRSFISKALHLPSTTLHFLLRWTFGAHAAYDENKNPVPRTDKRATSRGLMSAILESVKRVGVWLADSVYKHETAVSTAFWLSAILAGAAALTVFLWPAALAAVTTLSIGGLSIAAVFGTSTAGLVGGVAAVTAAVTSVATYLVAGIANFAKWARGSSDSATAEADATATVTTTDEVNTNTTTSTVSATTAVTVGATIAATIATPVTATTTVLAPEGNSSIAAMSRLGAPQKANVVQITDAPVHSFKAPAPAAREEVEEQQSSFSMGA